MNAVNRDNQHDQRIDNVDAHIVDLMKLSNFFSFFFIKKNLDDTEKYIKPDFHDNI